MYIDEHLSEHSQKIVEAYLSKHYRKPKAAQHSRKTKIVQEGLSPWEKNYNQLCALKEKQGHCSVPFKSALYGWVAKQRHVYKKGQLDSWQIKHLNALGFD